MLDITSLRKDLTAVVAALEKRKNPQAFLNVDAFTGAGGRTQDHADPHRRAAAQRNSLSKQIGQLKAKGESADGVMAQVAALKDELERSAARLDQLQPEIQALLLAVPNLPHASVPVGAGEDGNVKVREWGKPRAMDFAARDHVDIGTPWAWTLKPASSWRVRASPS